MRIVILGWGSLINDPGALPINREIGNNGWQEKGPMLPIEFARISNGNRLTLVVCPEGKKIQTMWAEVIGDDLALAIQALQVREGLPSIDRVGYINLPQNSFSEFSSRADLDEIRNWAEANRFDAVVWTGLVANFEEKTQRLFGERRELTIENIEWFLKKIKYSEFQAAKQYILSAPPSTNTALRPELTKLLQSGRLIPETVVMHESGHILIALKFGWQIQDLQVNTGGPPLEVQYCKNVNGQRICGVINNSTIRVAVETNLERLVISQGGWAADKAHSQPEDGQYERDEYNANIITAELPDPQPELSKIREQALRIIEMNVSALNQINSDLERYINGDRDVAVFNNNNYNIQ